MLVVVPLQIDCTIGFAVTIGIGLTVFATILDVILEQPPVLKVKIQ